MSICVWLDTPEALTQNQNHSPTHIHVIGNFFRTHLCSKYIVCMHLGQRIDPVDWRKSIYYKWIILGLSIGNIC